MAAKNSNRKLLVMMTLNLTSLSGGFTYGHMTGVSRALLQHDEGIVFTDTQLSWIASFASMSGFIGLLLAVTSDVIGRKWACVMFSVPLALNWIVLYYARTFTAFMISRLLIGMSVSPLAVLSLVATAEYSSTKSRGVMVSLVTMVTPALGNVIGHLLGVIINWRLLTIVGLILSIIHLLLPLFWIESPQWLASKGKFEECATAFRKIHGSNQNSEEELRLLIIMETNKLEANHKMNSNTVKKMLSVFRKQYFWELMLFVTFLYAYIAAAGKVLFFTLATVVLEDITGSSDIFVYTFVIDGFVFIGTCISCILIKKSTIRFLLFSSGLTANFILVTLGVCLCFNNSEVYFQWIKVILLAFYFVIVNAGPYPVIEILLGEMFPLEMKMYFFFLSTPMATVTVSFSLLFLPQFISAMGYHGLFLMNAGIVFICLGFFYAKLPETKGKTLQEIELYFKTKNFDVDEVLNKNEQIKSFI